MFLREALTRKFFSLALCGLFVSALSLPGCRKRRPATEWGPHYQKAVEAYRQGEYRSAISLFEKALVYEPSNVDIYLDIAGIYDDFLGDAANAVSFYQKFLENPTSDEKARWARRWASDARKRLSPETKEEGPATAESETVEDKEELILSLREELRVTKRSLAEERERTKNLSARATALNARLAAAAKERQELQDKLAAYSRTRLDVTEAEQRKDRRAISQTLPPWHRHWVTLGWLLSACLAFLVVALIIRQRHARTAERALLASIQASASGASEEITKDDILGKYYWVENDHSAGVLSFTEKDDEVHVCAIDGTTRLRSRGKGQLVGNVLTAELSSPGEEGVITKFIFANKGRTLTAVWQGDEGTAVAAGTKEVND